VDEDVPPFFQSLFAMSARRPWAAIAVAASLLAPAAANPFYIDYSTAAFSSAPTELDLCGTKDSLIAPESCKSGEYEKVPAQIERALQAALAKAPANVRPLLKRDQIFFAEMIGAAAGQMPESENPDDRKSFAEMLQRRIAVLDDIASGFGRTGVLGKWADAFGSVTVTPADGGTYRLRIDGHAVYGTEDDRHWQCRASALLKPSSDGWLTGVLLQQAAAPAPSPGDAPPRPSVPPPVKIRRQGETLRVVIGGVNWGDWRTHLDCKDIRQVTGSYFGSGSLDPAVTPDKVDIGFVTPTFDCTRPDTASDEETCSDPDLAKNDQRLNRAWKALPPRLDEATRHALAEDQRSWVRAQANQYPQFLHPAWDKTTYLTHYTSDARLQLNKMQRERIALLEGFDENRKGFVGVWLSSTAILNVTPTDDDGLKGTGWKWEQGDWKAGCDYDIAGRAVGGVFRSDEARTNPDTLERDHAMLIVNRLDDVFAKKREDPTDSDEPKCRRSNGNSSTARLFPAKPSPDINDFGQSIR
jgi:uncharacterized protein YecT (DUF1311 family)